MSEAEKMYSFMVGCVASESQSPTRICLPTSVFIDFYQEFLDMRKELETLREVKAILDRISNKEMK